MENEKESITQTSSKNAKFSIKIATVIFIIISCCAFLLYLTLGAFLNQELDLLRFNLPWAVSGAKDGLFSIYLLEEPAVDYPPIFPTLLSFFGVPLIYFYSTIITLSDISALSAILNASSAFSKGIS